MGHGCTAIGVMYLKALDIISLYIYDHVRDLEAEETVPSGASGMVVVFSLFELQCSNLSMHRVAKCCEIVVSGVVPFLGSNLDADSYP